MESSGLTMGEAAQLLKINDRTIRRAIRAYRDFAGPVNSGVVNVRGRQIAFRKGPGARNEEYRLWLDASEVPGGPEPSPPPLSVIQARLEHVEAALEAILERLDRLERAD